MFTGIIQNMCPVVAVERKPGLVTFTIKCPKEIMEGVATGASVSIDGTCLTVVKIEGNTLTFDCMQETLSITTLSSLSVGRQVNVERSYKVGDEVGGHILSGHITGTAEIVNVEIPENNHVVTFKIPVTWMDYIMPKGFIAIDGASLTIVDVDKKSGTFSVWLIPETLERTTFGAKQVGEKVNIELDSRTQAIVDTMKAYLKDYPSTNL